MVGPTGGYLIGFLFLTWIGGSLQRGILENHCGMPVGMILGTVCIYIFGTIWYMILMKTEFWYALSVCVFPFVIFDALKIVAACTVGETIRKRIKY